MIRRCAHLTLVSWALCASCPAADDAVLEQPGAVFRVEEGDIEPLKKKRQLYTDRDYVMKERPRELSSTRYVLASFAGCTAHCEEAGVAFALGLFDVHNQEQTRRVETYLKENEWNRLEAVPPFALFYTNGADRMGALYWKSIKQGETLTFPNGTILCFKRRK